MASFADTPDNRKGRANIRLDGGAYQYFTFTFEYDSDGNPIDIVIYDSTGTEIPDPAPTLITKIENVIPPYTPPIGAFLWESDGANAVNQISDNENIYLLPGAGAASTGIRNVFIGFDNGSVNEGNYNTFIGDRAGRLNTTGFSNTFIGWDAGYSNTTGRDNTYVGYKAGEFTSTGSFNFGFGYLALQNNTGSYNNGYGYYAGNGNTSGNFNFFLGSEAGRLSTTGSNNNFIGRGSGYNNGDGDSNNYIGYQAGYNSSGVDYNTYIGYQTGYNATGGFRNIGFGYRAQYAVSSGAYNFSAGWEATRLRNASYAVHIGYRAGFGDGGSYNTFIQAQAGFSQVGGTQNIAIGFQSLYSAVSTSKSIAIGYQAGFNETASNRLHIANNVTTSLIYGEFDNEIIRINGELEVRDKSGTFLNVASWDGDKIIDSGVPISSLGQGVGAVDAMESYAGPSGTWFYRGVDESGVIAGELLNITAGTGLTMVENAFGNGFTLNVDGASDPDIFMSRDIGSQSWVSLGTYQIDTGSTVLNLSGFTHSGDYIKVPTTGYYKVTFDCVINASFDSIQIRLRDGTTTLFTDSATPNEGGYSRTFFEYITSSSTGFNFQAVNAENATIRDVVITVQFIR